MEGPETIAANSEIAESLTDVVVREVAETSDVSPLDLPPLQSAVDPDALNNLFDPRWTDADPAGHVTFAYAGYEVTVYADHTVAVGPLPDVGGGRW